VEVIKQLVTSYFDIVGGLLGVGCRLACAGGLLAGATGSVRCASGPAVPSTGSSAFQLCHCSSQPTQ
jgi:hypothetical protein